MHAVVGEVVADVDVEDLADDQPGGADGDDVGRPALEGDGGLADAGGWTSRLGSGVRPAWSNSELVEGRATRRSAAIASAYDSSAMLTTNSPRPPSSTGRALRRVSFIDPSALGPPTVKARLSGVWLAIVK